MENLICPNCEKRFSTKTRIPLIIPCQEKHTICQNCILELFSSKKGYLKCPIDNTKCRLQEEDLEDLPKNKIIENCLNELLENSCRKHYNPLDNFCIDCSKKICKKCTMKKHREHNIRKLEEIEGEINDIFSYYRQTFGNIDFLSKDFHEKIIREGEKCLEKIDDHFIQIKNNLEKFVANKKNAIRNCIDERLKKQFSSRKQEKIITEWRNKSQQLLCEFDKAGNDEERLDVFSQLYFLKDEFPMKEIRAWESEMAQGINFIKSNFINFDDELNKSLCDLLNENSDGVLTLDDLRDTSEMKILPKSPSS